MTAIKILIEIGHESSLKAKPTAEGYTHDWELFVRSCHPQDISHFIEKVVFNLHESFAKPKRAIKEPPYVVKESGYAGFEVVIDIYVKNRDEPKKISFHYDMDLQNSGPSICRTQTFSHTFTNPPEDFKRKLLKGGGVLVQNPSSMLAAGSTAAPGNGDLSKGATGVAVPTMSSGKKAREQPVNSEFANLFGTPITKTAAPPTNSSASSATATLKVSPDAKVSAGHRKSSPSRNNNNNSNAPSKGSSAPPPPHPFKSGGSSSSSKEKNSSSSASVASSRSRQLADSPHGDKYERRGDADRTKRERNRSREKSSVVGNNGGKDKSQKRRPSSPKYSSPSRSGSVATAAKNRSPTAGPVDLPASAAKGAALGSGSSGNKKSSKKERKDKSHDKERGATTGASIATSDYQVRDQPSYASKKEKRPDTSGFAKDSAGSKYSAPKEATTTNGNSSNSRPDERGKKEEKGKSTQDRDTVNQPVPEDAAAKKHKHKKKDKEKGKATAAEAPMPFALTPINKGATTPTFGKDKRPKQRSEKPRGSPGMATKSSSEKSLDGFGYNNNNHKMQGNESDEGGESLAEPLQIEDAKVPSSSGKGRRSEKAEKRKRKAKDGSDNESEGRNKRRLRDDLTDGSTASPNKMEPPQKLPRKQPPPPAEDQYVGKNGNEAFSESSANAHQRLAEPDYIQELKMLQHKIMSLQDSNDLQQVVEIIAATGLYEIADATKTFDFDLCVLNVDTVQRLKDFFLRIK